MASKNQGRSSHSWEVHWPGELGPLGDDWVSNEGWTALMSGLTPGEGIDTRALRLGVSLSLQVCRDCAMLRVGGDGGCCVVA